MHPHHYTWLFFTHLFVPAIALFLVFFAGIAAYISSRRAILRRKVAAYITQSEWFDAKRQIGAALNVANYAKNTADSVKGTVGVLAGDVIHLQTDALRTGARVAGIDTLVRSLEKAPVPQVINLNELRLETSNATDEIREEVRLFMEAAEQRITALEIQFEEPQGTPNKRKAKRKKP